MKDLMIALPEIALLMLSCLVLVLDLFIAKRHQFLIYLFSQISIVLVALSCAYVPASLGNTAFSQHFVADPFAQFLKILILIVMFFVLLYSRVYAKERKIAQGEFHALALFSTLGMMCLVSAHTLLMIYLGLELLSLPLYAMVALQKDSPVASEASMKYFVMGALASGMLLYGMSLLYGITGSIGLGEVASVLQTETSHYLVALFALAFITVGVAFKLGAVPFHMWIPDVYQGAPTHMTLFIATAPKIAAFGMVFRLLHDALPSLGAVFSQYFIVLALLSLAIGNIGAIVQTNIKRLFAYSTIAHVGFLFLALLVSPQSDYSIALYYIAIYVMVALCAFGLIIWMSHVGFEAENLDDFKGLAKRSPWFALMMLLVAFSLAGVPPTAGFYAKFLVLNALVDADLTWLAGVALIFTIMGAFYYLKIIRVMYFEAPQVSIALSKRMGMNAALSINGLAILALGIFPAPFFMLCRQVFS